MRTHHLGEVLGPGFTPESSQDTVCGGGVRLVMTEVVNLHRGLVKMGFQGVVFVGELGEIKRLGMGLGQTQETSAKRSPRNPRDGHGRRKGSKDTTVLGACSALEMVHGMAGGGVRLLDAYSILAVATCGSWIVLCFRPKRW